MNRIMLALLAAGVAAVMVFSTRSWSMLDSPQVVVLAPLRPAPAVEQILGENDSRAVLPYGHAAAAAPPAEAAGRSLGFAYRDVSLLKMAFWSYADPGFVAVQSGADGYEVEPLTLDQVKRIDAAIGTHAADYRFPFWRNLWGWLFVAGFLLWFIVQRRAETEAEDDGDGWEASEAAA
jgi:hypothetical protein